MATRASGGTPAGGAKCGLKPPTASTKPWCGPEPQPARSAAAPVSDELPGQPRVDQHSVDGGGVLVEVEDPDGVEVDAHEIVVGRGQERAHAPEDEEAPARAELQDQRQVERDQRRCEPADAGQDAEQVAAAPGWEGARPASG